MFTFEWQKYFLALMYMFLRNLVHNDSACMASDVCIFQQDNAFLCWILMSSVTFNTLLSTFCPL